MKKFWILKIIKGIVMFTAFFALATFVVMWLWNEIIPGLTGWEMLTFWKAAGLLVLAKILFGSHGGGRMGRHWWGGRRSHMWKKKWDEKLQHMTPEERENMKAMWKQRFCDWHHPEETVSTSPENRG